MSDSSEQGKEPGQGEQQVIVSKKRLQQLLQHTMSVLADAQASTTEASFEAGKREGIKEVVDWVETSRTRIGRSGKDSVASPYVYLGLDWQAQCEEWGIELPEEPKR